MNAREIISTIMKEKGESNGTLSTKLGYKHPSGVSERLRGKKGIRDDLIVSFLEAMNCELVIRDKETKQEWVVTASKEDVDLDSLLSEEG